MKNKILIKIYVPNIDELFEIYIPTNESVKKIIDLIVKSVYELSEENLDLNIEYKLFDPSTAQLYNITEIVRNTNIINSKKVVLI